MILRSAPPPPLNATGSATWRRRVCSTWKRLSSFRISCVIFFQSGAAAWQQPKMTKEAPRISRLRGPPPRMSMGSVYSVAEVTSSIGSNCDCMSLNKALTSAMRCTGFSTTGTRGSLVCRTRRNAPPPRARLCSAHLTLTDSSRHVRRIRSLICQSRYVATGWPTRLVSMQAWRPATFPVSPQRIPAVRLLQRSQNIEHLKRRRTTRITILRQNFQLWSPSVRPSRNIATRRCQEYGQRFRTVASRETAPGLDCASRG
mmetsp:Transcript_1455/g.4223  ORF Transcript_1455/g.4223 Transcript_1455/m.4223 type:complete len:258 (-) Transcript_1455:1191-1964(-)